ncbi:MAG TPA: NUDIX domain-containing protein [Caulobacteraceae bacterium]|nr:NUDIX domain-containing protein [Caulobacteraceae bacterium]
MAAQHSAGLLVFRRRGDSVDFLLAHPGGPFWKNRDDGAWSIPKGLVGEGEETRAAAAREFAEEVGQRVEGEFIALTPCRQKSGKIVHAWMVEADLDLGSFHSNTFDLEWPKGSGRTAAFPEIDKVAYLDPEAALRKILPGQAPLIAEALERLGRR